MNDAMFALQKFLHKQHHVQWAEVFAFAVAVLLIGAAVPTSAAKRFQERSLYMNDATPSATTSYKISFKYMSSDAIGSVDMLFCIDPIPYMPCITPPGLIVSNSTLSAQTGEVDFSIQTKTANHIVLTRPPIAPTASVESSYTFDNIVNPSDANQAFAIRLRSHSSTDATGPQIDFGSVRGQVTESIIIETQVPPILVFCSAGQVAEDCSSTDNNYYTDMGDLQSDKTLTAQSEMAVGTNASSGFVITANGSTLSAGINTIDPLALLTESRQGVNQFGINLVANNSPNIGADPIGPWTNANPTANYSVPNKYKYVSGEVIAESPNVSLIRKFTVSYVVNVDDNLRAGVYSTTITYVASGRF